MPQGSYLGPLTFIILIDDLRPSCLTHKYIDDTTMTEILKKAANSCMQSFVDDLVKQSTNNAMKINQRKTKEMLIGPIVNKNLAIANRSRVSCINTNNNTMTLKSGLEVTQGH